MHQHIGTGEWDVWDNQNEEEKLKKQLKIEIKLKQMLNSANI